MFSKKIDFHSIKQIDKHGKRTHRGRIPELAPIKDEGENEEQSLNHEERLIIDPKRMKLVEQTIKMLNL